MAKNLRITLVINPYLTDQDVLPSHVISVLKNAIIAKQASIYCEVKLCLAMDSNEKQRLLEQLNQHDLSDFEPVNLRYSQRYPMVGDILRSAQRFCQKGDYICFINSDINLFYWFFDLVAMSVRGHQPNTGFIINRKDLADESADLVTSDGHLDTIYHPGFDCHVFPQDMLDYSHFGSCTVGFPPVGNLLATNMLENLAEVRLLKDSFITWHQGDGRLHSTWQKKQKEIDENFMAAFRALDKLQRHERENSGRKLKTFSQAFMQKYNSYRNKCV